MSSDLIPFPSPARIRAYTFATLSYLINANKLKSNFEKLFGPKSFMIFTPKKINRISPELRSGCKYLHKGFGYWRWKPLLTNHMLFAYPQDLLLYIDAGCTLNKSLPSIMELYSLFCKLDKSSCGLILFDSRYSEEAMSNISCINHLESIAGMKVNKAQQHTIATYYFHKNTDYTRKLFGVMSNLSLSQPSLFTDEYSHIDETHRHDQSILSILSRLMGNPVILDDLSYLDVKPSRHLKDFRYQASPILSTRTRNILLSYFERYLLWK